jgi:hypothetical protein
VGAIREVVAIIVPADSLAARLVREIDDIVAHLPSPDEPRACPMCPAHSWPCAGFDAAACRVKAAGLRLDHLVPQDLHSRLWPTQPPTQPAPQTAWPSTREAETFDKESVDG